VEAGGLMVRFTSLVKQKFVSDERLPRTIVAGAFRGIRMNLNLANQTQLLLGLFERETYPWLYRFSNGIRTAIDIGAASGEYTLFFLKCTNAAMVYVFEPDAAVVPHLKHNLELNRDVVSERVLISTDRLGRPNLNGIVHLDSLAQEIRPPCFIKMDVDGAELDILLGATAINALPDVRWLIETHSSELESKCANQLALAGFKIQIVRNAWWRFVVPELRPGPHNRWLVAWK
jgi:Methyltransferase FkbM domain